MREGHSQPIWREVRVIGIGPGDPSLLTEQAAEVIAKLDVVLLIDKGDEGADLAELRREVLRRHARPGHRVATVVDPVRDREGPYVEAVREWHRARARSVAARC